MNKFCYKVLSMTEGYIFKSNKYFIGPVNDICDNKIIMESNFNQCKEKILSKYKYQSVIVYKFNTNNILSELNNTYSKNRLDYESVVKKFPIHFDEHNIMSYYKKIDELEKNL